MQIEEKQITRPWQSITADFLDMPQIQDENTRMKLNQVLVIVDRFSKFTILIPTRKEATTEEIYELLWTHVFAIFGLPEQMTSDRDKIFRTTKWETLMKNDGIRTILSTAHHQQTDGQSERKIQEVQTYFRIYMDFEQKNWKKICPTAQYALNDAESAATKETPNFTVFGTNRNEKGNEQGRLKIFHETIKNELDWNKQIQKKYYDKGRVEAFHLKEGDRVYLRRRSVGEKKFNIRTTRRSSKYDYRKLGPFKVKKCLKYDNYELELPERMQIHPVFHISLLSKTKNPTTEEDIEVKDDEYEVDEILNKRITNGQAEYLVKWLGYDESEATWEPTRNLYCPEKIQEFEDSNSTKRVPEKVFG
jgi:Chromo (CHRromatin Organisation MOdifier) domain/Integrase core domain